jgi:hypothetical protein
MLFIEVRRRRGPFSVKTRYDLMVFPSPLLFLLQTMWILSKASARDPRHKFGSDPDGNRDRTI